MTAFFDFAQSLQLALKAMSMYTARHPRAAEALQGFQARLVQELSDRPSLQVVVSNGVVFVDGQPIEGTNVHVKALARQFAERAISGVVFLPQATVADCQAFLEVLILKPARIEEQGGVAKVFDGLRLTGITLSQTQYREVREGEPAGEGGGEGAEAASAPPPKPEPRPLEDFDPFATSSSMKDWMDYLHHSVMDRGLDDLLGGATPQMPWDPPFAGALPPADLSGLATHAEQLGWGSGLPPTQQLEGFRRALMDLDGAHQLSVLQGEPTLAPLPPALRIAFRALAPEVFATAATRLLGQGVAWDGLQSTLLGMLQGNPDRQTWLDVLAGGLLQAGLGLDRLESLVQQLAWDDATLEGQVRRTEDPLAFWQLSLEQRLAFLRRLLEQGLTDRFMALLDHVLQRLTSEAPGPREAAARTLGAVVLWLEEPVFPLEAEGALLDGLKGHVAWEPLPALLDLTTEALGKVLAHFVIRGELRLVTDLLQELEGLFTVLGEGVAATRETLQQLRSRLSEPSAFEAALRVLYTLEAPDVPVMALPYFEALGAPGAQALMGRLAEEPDRRRRGRLMELLRAMGDEAIPAIQAALHHETWFVVRNALNLLAELGHAGLVPDVASCLRHGDPRVRQAAVRALWKLGGPAADGPLLELLPTTDPDTQMEVLFGLGQIQSPRASNTLLAFATDSRIQERLRVKALEVVGVLGQPESQGALAELLKRRGRIFTSAEPLPVRLAAARALLGLSLPQATALVREVVASEPRGADRDALQALLGAATR